MKRLDIAMAAPGAYGTATTNVEGAWETSAVLAELDPVTPTRAPVGWRGMPQTQ